MGEDTQPDLEREISEQNTEALADWAIRYGLDDLKCRTESLVAIKKEAVTSLTVLLAGATGGLAYAVKGFDDGTVWLISGASTFAAYLYILCALLVAKVLEVKQVPALYALPATIFQPGYSVLQLKRGEINSLGRRIEQIRSLVDKSAVCLNRLRLAAIASPLFFIAAAIAGPVLFQAEGRGTSVSAPAAAASLFQPPFVAEGPFDQAEGQDN